jgi:hypothetical protein
VLSSPARLPKSPCRHSQRYFSNKPNLFNILTSHTVYRSLLMTNMLYTVFICMYSHIRIVRTTIQHDITSRWSLASRHISHSISIPNAWTILFCNRSYTVTPPLAPIVISQSIIAQDFPSNCNAHASALPAGPLPSVRFELGVATLVISWQCPLVKPSLGYPRITGYINLQSRGTVELLI